MKKLNWTSSPLEALHKNPLAQRQPMGQQKSILVSPRTRVLYLSGALRQKVLNPLSVDRPIYDTCNCHHCHWLKPTPVLQLCEIGEFPRFVSASFPLWAFSMNNPIIAVSRVNLEILLKTCPERPAHLKATKGMENKGPSIL